MKNPALVSRFFRIGTSGPTVDGRDISADDLEDMAASYDMAEFTATINVEHIRGISPWSAFGSLGTVTALKTEKDKKDRTVLLAQVSPTPYMIQLKAAGQKLFSSMEIQPNFAATEKPYLVGLAVTDQPASLGIEAMQFSANNNGPVDPRFRDNLFTPNLEMDSFAMENPDDTNAETKAPTGGDPSFMDKFKAKFAKKEEGDTAKFSDLEDATLDLATKFSELETSQTELTKKFDAQTTENETLTATVATQAEEITKLSAALAGTSDGETRPLATPKEGVNQTDC